jgi:hypothetical protein
MDFKYCRTIFLIVTVLSLILIMSTKSFASNYNQTYTFHTKINNIEISHKLYISVPSSLYNYYQKQNHNTFNIEDFSKFVTPNVFRSIAENVQNVTRNMPYSDEVFANAVLEIVHQIQYNKTDLKFPTETIVDNSGDCDTLSLLAASIMKAGDLDVVLLFYEDSHVSHINIGVHLLNEPVYYTKGTKPFYYEYNDKKYFTAESTGDNWKVGDQPQDYISTEPKIISIKNHEKTSFAQISSNLDSPLIPSSISLSLIPESLKVEDGGTNITISGSISPRYPKQQVTVNINHESNPLSIHKTVTTDKLGNYSLTLNFNTTGIYTIQTSWNGIQNYAGSDSEKLTVNIALNQLLDKYEVNQTVTVGSESIQIISLNSAGYRILSNQPIKKIFEKNFTGTGILISSEFIILGNIEPYLTEHRITLPSFEQIIIKGGRISTKTIPEQTVIIPNYRQQMHNHLEFTLIQNGKEDYSVSVRLLDNSDISKIIEKSDPILINASDYVRENTWYNMTANISENQIIFKLFDENTTHLTKTALIDYTNNTKELKILVKYEPDSIIVFKDLQAGILEQPTQLIEGYKPPFNIPYMRSIDPPEPEEPPKALESKAPEPEESIQEFAFPTTIVIIAAILVLAIVLIIFRAYRKLK